MMAEEEEMVLKLIEEYDLTMPKYPSEKKIDVTYNRTMEQWKKSGY